MVTPQPCPHPLQRKSKLLSITFKTLQNLTLIQPSDFTGTVYYCIPNPSPVLDHYSGKWAMLPNASALHIIMAVLQSSYAYSGVSALFFLLVKVTLEQMLVETLRTLRTERKKGGYVWLSYTLPASVSLVVLSRFITQPAPSIPPPTFIHHVVNLCVFLTGLLPWEGKHSI